MVSTDARAACRCPVYHQMLAARELGGAALVGIGIANHLRDGGRRTLIWTPGEGRAAETARQSGLVASVLPVVDAVNSNPLRAVIGNWRAFSAMRGGGPHDLVHVHCPYLYGAISRGLALAGIRRVVHVHLDMGVSGLRWALKRPPELVITCARFLKDVVQSALPDRADRTRVEAVPNSVETARFYPLPKDEAKRRVGADPGAPLLLMLANLSPHKGHETALRAVGELKARGTHAACWFAGVERNGGKRYTDRLVTLAAELGISDQVRLLGFRQDAPELLRAADVLLLPSKREGLPLTILEAQASKTPVIASPTAGIPEVIDDGETGYLVPADDWNGYADRIQRLITSAQVYGGIADRAYSRILKEHTFTTYAERICALYDSLGPGQAIDMARVGDAT